MENDVNITGKKVILRAVREQDAKMLSSLIRDPEIVKVTKGYPDPASGRDPADQGRFLSVSDGSVRRVIVDRENPESGLGMIILSHMDERDKTAQIYIKLLRSARGMGYGRDAVDALVSYAFDGLLLNCVCSGILENNAASRRLFEACGFRLEGTHESGTDREGRSRRVCVYVRRKASGVS